MQRPTAAVEKYPVAVFAWKTCATLIQEGTSQLSRGRACCEMNGHRVTSQTPIHVIPEYQLHVLCMRDILSSQVAGRGRGVLFVDSRSYALEQLARQPQWW